VPVTVIRLTRLAVRWIAYTGPDRGLPCDPWPIDGITLSDGGGPGRTHTDPPVRECL
jgi:hypothetical protein